MTTSEPGVTPVEHGNQQRCTVRSLALAAAILLAAAVWLIASSWRSPQPITFGGETMGTTYTVKLARLPAGASAAQLKRSVDDALREVNRKMSTYDPNSELSRWNAAGEDWFPVSEDTARVVAESLRIGRLTDGAFDVTVGPLVRLWRFGPGASLSDAAAPSAEQLAAAQSLVGYQRIDVEMNPPRVRRRIAGGSVDLSAIAKGFGVDRAAEVLEAAGVQDYMVEVGGEVRARGVNHAGLPWTIAIETPRLDARTVFRTVRLRDASLATSGDYRNYREIEGRRYCHLIDPRTGKPIEHQLASVSVIHASCMTADAWATALSVLGPEQAMTTAEKNGLDVLLIVRVGDRFECRTTPGFAAWSAEEH